jgi:cytochrome b561
MARYTRTAAVCHWSIALLIVAQIASGLWMARAINDPQQWMLAAWAYQVHKSIGLAVLWLTVFRVFWRLRHPPPPLPTDFPAGLRTAIRLGHGLLYGLMCAVPLAGWLVVSTSPLGLPTLMFGWLNWPHLPVPLSLEPSAKLAHRWLAYALGALAAGHVAAALKHQIYDRLPLLRRMSLRLKP